MLTDKEFTNRRKLLLERLKKEGCEPVTFLWCLLLEEGDDLAEYGFDAKIMHIPGHTNGSIGVFAEGCGLIAGDILSNVKKPEPASNAVDFALLNKSIEKLKGKGVKHIYPGHGLPFSL